MKFQDADSDDAHRELWLQQIERSWSNVPHIHAIVSMVSTLTAGVSLLCSVVMRCLGHIMLSYLLTLELQRDLSSAIFVWQSPVATLQCFWSQLSADCRDLLDRIFVVDDAKRITIDQIR